MNQNQILLLRNKNDFILKINNQEYIINDDIIVKYNLTNNKILNDNEINLIINDINKYNSYNDCIKYISSKFRSKNEIIEFLGNNIYKEEFINKLLTLGYINDLELAKSIYNECILSLKGKECFIKNLNKRKIYSYYDLYSLDKEKEVLDKFISKQLDITTFDTLLVFKKKLYSKIIYRGFSICLIDNAINNIKFNDRSKEVLDLKIQKFKNKYKNKDSNQKIINYLISIGYNYNDIKDRI